MTLGTSRRPTTADEGTALVGTIAGVVVFLAFLFTAVQLLTRLYAVSTVTAVATDAARSVASREVDHTDERSVAAAEADAEARARSALGDYQRHVRFDWSVDRSSVRLRLRVEAPPAAFGGLVPLRAFQHVERTVVLHVEDAA